MRKKLKYLLILLAIATYGCCDCLDASDPIPPFCNPQEATVTEFIAEFTSNIEEDDNGDDIVVFNPTPPFSVHGFLFPDQLLTDERFDPESGIEGISFEEEFLPIDTEEGGLKIATLSSVPINEDLNADITVVSVDVVSLTRSALLRFKGRLNYFTDNETSESSEEFCEFIEENGLAMQELDITRFGEDIQDGSGDISLERDYSNEAISLLTSDNNILVKDIANPDPVRQVQFEGEVLNEVAVLNEVNLLLALGNFGGGIELTNAYDNLQERLNDNEYISVDIEVNIGDVFVYEAMNGGRYTVNIINIDQRDNNAIKKRVSFQFSRL